MRAEARELTAICRDLGLPDEPGWVRVQFRYRAPQAVIEVARRVGREWLLLGERVRADSRNAAGLGRYVVAIYVVPKRYDLGTPPPPTWVWDRKYLADPVPQFRLRETVRYGESPVYLGKRWRRGGVEVVMMCGLEQPHDEIDRNRAWRGLQHLAFLPHGKQEGAGVEPVESFIENVERALRKVWKDKGRVPSEAEAAKAFGLSKSQFHDRLRAQGWRWPLVNAWRPGGKPLRELLGVE